MPFAFTLTSGCTLPQVSRVKDSIKHILTAQSLESTKNQCFVFLVWLIMCLVLNGQHGSQILNRLYYKWSTYILSLHLKAKKHEKKLDNEKEIVKICRFVYLLCMTYHPIFRRYFNREINQLSRYRQLDFNGRTIWEFLHILNEKDETWKWPQMVLPLRSYMICWKNKY